MSARPLSTVFQRPLVQIAARLHALYSTAAVFTCTGSTDGTGSRATISLPLELAGHDGGGAA